MLRYKPFTGLLPVLPQYRTAQYSPFDILTTSDSSRLSQTGSDTFRQPLDHQYRLFPALYRLFPHVLPSVQYYPLFPECTSVNTVLPGPHTWYPVPTGPCTWCPRLCTAYSTVLQAFQLPSGLFKILPLIWPSSTSRSLFIKIAP